MIFWLDAQRSPGLATWIQSKFFVECKAVRDLNLLQADDKTIFFAARDAKAVVKTKDKDFVNLLMQFGVPPQVIWLNCGNTSNLRVCEILEKSFSTAMDFLTKSEPLVEISD